MNWRRQLNRRLLIRGLLLFSLSPLLPFSPTPFLPFSPSSVSAQDQVPDDPVSWTIKAEPQSVPPGGKLSVQLTARVEKSWHLYSLDQEEGGPIPTRIKLPAEQPFEMAGDIESPRPRVTFDKNFNLNTEFYEGEVTFTLPVKALAGGATGQQKILVQVRYQSCNDTLCLPPKLAKLEVEVTIKTEK